MLLSRMLWLCILLTGTLAVQAQQTITMGTGISMPPYVIAAKDRGIAVDLFRAAMEQVGIKVKIAYDDNANVLDSFNDRALDVIFVANRELAPNAYFSNLPLVVFHNQAVALEGGDVKLERVRDLRYYRLGGFRLASKLLPAPFAATSERAVDYREYVQQIEQVQDLFRKDRQVLVIDSTIFRYYLSQLRRQNPSSEMYRQQYKYFDLFPKSRYFAVFHDPDMKKAFDEGFAKIRKNGRYERILRTYQALLSDYLFR